jgi:iron(III) transport system substrate-binding protein
VRKAAGRCCPARLTAMRIVAVFAALALIVAAPFALKPRDDLLAEADDSIVIITPHNEHIRYEFSRAFGEHYKQKTGRTIRIDWRMPGGTSEIARYIKGGYYAAFERMWRGAGKEWSAAAYSIFDDPRAQSEARREFLASNVGIGVDLFFGGGAFDFQQQAEAGRLVDCEIRQTHPDWFADHSIPHVVSGEIFYDQGGRWIGAALSSFGICYNSDSLRRLGVSEIPSAWSDLGNPRFFKQVALADPTKSGSAAKAFEMIIQQQMQEVMRSANESEETSLQQGWARGLQIIQRASANARYFSNAASQVPVDVSLGDAAIGMCIDFYGRLQSEEIRVPNTPSRLQYFTPAGGSAVGVDPIALFRGAPNAQAAKMFIEFVLSLEGQKLWDFKVGTPGGPRKYALRRQPIRKELYSPEYAEYRSDPGVDPYEEAKTFTYHPKWTGPLFKVMGFVIRIMCLDSHDEQVAAWKALIASGFPSEATALFSNMDAVNYKEALEKFRPALSTANRIEEVQLARQLGEKFRAQYRAAKALAKQGK